MVKLRNNWKLIGILALVLICLPFTEVSAASKLNLYLYSTKKNLVYTSTQAKYTFNGKTINMKDTPGIIIEGTSLASFLDVFVNSGIGLKYSYNKSKGVLTLSQNDKKLVLTEGSKTAVLNGKKVTMSQAPTKITFKDNKKTKYMVPVTFVAESFGYVYTWNSSTATGEITSPMNLSYNGSKVAYTGTKGAVTIDKKKVDVSDMPSIIVNNTALLQAYKVFSSSSIKADYNFDKSTGVLTLSNSTTKVVLTMGKKTAYVNGKARTMDTAPLLVTNLDTKVAYVMVPGSFVASYLGYDYKWDSASKTSNLTKSKIVTLPDSGNGGPELSDDPIPDTTTFSWGIAASNLEEYTKLSNLGNALEVSQDTQQSSYITGITKVESTANSETYAISGTAPFSKSTLTKQDTLLTLHINNATGNNQTLSLGGSLASLVTLSADTTDTTAFNLVFSLAEQELKYELSLSPDSSTLYVKLYRNYINLITAGVSSGEEFLQISGMKDLKVDLTESGNMVTLQFPSTVNGIGTNNIQTNLAALKAVTSSTAGNTSVITFEKNSNAGYRVEQNGTSYKIIFEIEVSTGYSIEFKLPSDLSFSDITSEDQYYKNRILIQLPGDRTDFFNQNPVAWSDNIINKLGLLVEGGKTKIVIDTATLQGYKLTDLGNNKVGITLGNPKDIYKNIVVLDAGHGGTDPGAVRSLNGKTIYEKDLNYKIMYELTRQYFNSPDSEVKAYYSRYDDTKVNLYDRAAFADLVGADMFVSLHMNANTKSDPKGTEIYYYSANTSKNSAGLNSKTLATLVLNSMTDKLETQKRYISSQNLVVTRETNVPAILIELGFMSNKSDLTLLTNSDFQNRAALAIYESICEVFDAYPTGR